MTLVQLVNQVTGKRVSHVSTMHYDCVVCGGMNDNHAVSCHYCGTIPADYSILGRPSVLNENGQYIEVTRAYGSIQTQQRRAARAYFRTVPMDYYAASQHGE